MNKRLLAVVLAGACGAWAIPLAAVAQQANANPDPAATPVATASGNATAQRAVPPVDSRQCVRHTGSHIPAPKGQCLPVTGTSYTAKDLQRTGAVSTGEALRMLDPSVRVTGGH